MFFRYRSTKWDESLHPREDAGSAIGGQFASGGQVLAGGAGPGVNIKGAGGKVIHVATSQEGKAWLDKNRRAPDTTGELGSRENPIECGDNIEKAARLISNGQHVTLNQPDQVSTLVLKIKHDVDAAKEAGETPPVFNVADISVKGTNLFAQDNLDVPRVAMPQLAGWVDKGSKAAALMTPAEQADPKAEIDLTQKFIESLTASGIKSEKQGAPGETPVFASHLRATQDELDGAKIGGIASAMEAGTMKDPEARITVTRDNYILDGHHRWAATIVRDLEDNHPGDLPMRVIKLDIDIGTALSRAKAFQDEWGISVAALGKKNESTHVLKGGPGSGRYPKGSGEEDHIEEDGKVDVRPIGFRKPIGIGRVHEPLSWAQKDKLRNERIRRFREKRRLKK